MKKLVILLFALFILLTLVSLVFGVDGYTLCIEQGLNTNFPTVSADCFAEQYIPQRTSATTWCTGATGHIDLNNDAAAVGAVCVAGSNANCNTREDQPGMSCNTGDGVLVLEMHTGREIVALNAQPYDLYISEGSAVEPFRVRVSNNANGGWLDIGHVCTGSPGENRPLTADFKVFRGSNIYGFNIPAENGASFRYVEISTTSADAEYTCEGQELSNGDSDSGSSYGADIRFIVAGQVPCTHECQLSDVPYCDGNNAVRCVADPDGSYDGDTCHDLRETNCAPDVCNTGTCGPACTPQTCEQLGKECGIWDNGCGTNIPCGDSTGHCSNPGEYCTTTGACNDLPELQGGGFTCQGVSGNIVDTNSLITTSVDLDAYEGGNNIGSTTSAPLSAGGAFSITYATPYADDNQHTFILNATLPNLNPVEGGAVELDRATLTCPSCIQIIEDVRWNTTCIGAGSNVSIIFTASQACPSQSNAITPTVYEEDSNVDDPAQFQPQPRRFQAGQTTTQTQWTAEWQQDQFSTNPQYYINATLDGITVSSLGKPNGELEVQFCVPSLDTDCDTVPNTRDECPNTPHCTTNINSRGCIGGSTEGICAALWDCSTIEWGACTDGKITRDVCPEGYTGDPALCCSTWNVTQPGNCGCTFNGNATQFNSCGQGFTLVNERTCIAEETPFPAFSFLNILGVIFLLGIYYSIRRNS